MALTLAKLIKLELRLQKIHNNGLRSQMSSVDKNFDTLMERAFAETLNIRLRFPVITMGEVYLLPIEELDDEAMKKNKIIFKNRRVKIEKFIRTFNSFSGRSSLNLEEQYKYDASALILVDFKQDPPKIIYNKMDLKQYGFSEEVCSMFEKISAHGFDERLLEKYMLFSLKKGCWIKNSIRLKIHQPFLHNKIWPAVFYQCQANRIFQ